MSDEKQRSSAEAEEREPEKETSGQYLWRVLKPAGCILVLLLFIAYLVVCFTLKTPA